MVLAPFTSVFPLSLDEGLSEKTTLLSHSFQQLDRIDSLSEQIGFLEERLGTCEWPCNQVLIIKPENIAEDETPYHQKSNSSLLSLVSCRFLSRELASDDTKESRARIFSPKQLPSLGFPWLRVRLLISQHSSRQGWFLHYVIAPTSEGQTVPFCFCISVLNQCSCVLRLSRADADICIYPFKLWLRVVLSAPVDILYTL